MRHFLTGLTALLLMSAPGLLAQPTLFSTDGKNATSARSARSETRTRRVSANTGALAGSSLVDFNLFDDRRFLVQNIRTSSVGGATVWTGEVAGTTGSEVTMIVEDGRLTGSIRTADGSFYRIRPESDGSHTIEEVDASAAQIDDEALEAPPELLTDTIAEKSSDMHRAAASMASAALATSQSLVDVLVVYTPEARAAAGSTANILSRIQLAVAEANQGLINSGIDMQLRLVGTAEAAPSASQAANSTYLTQISTDATIAALRNQYGADMVSVWINGPGSGGGVVGIGWIMTRPSTTFQSAAFSVVELNFTNGPYYSFGHELGHNLGGAHDRANASSSGAYAYAYGYQQTSGSFVDIMAYTNGCSGCRRINNYSNPDVSVSGWPTGVASTAVNSADIRLTFNSTRTFAEQFRATVVPVTTTPTPTPTTPPPPAAVAPTVTSVSPSAGTGNSTVYTANFADGNGATDIRTVYLSIQTGTTANACYVSVDRSTGAVQLRNNADSGWTGGLTLGQAATLANSQCTISGSGASIAANGNALALNLPVAFASSFSGAHDVYLKADDAGGLTSTWQKLGTWTVPTAVVPPTPPSFTSLSPVNGSGSAATFTAVFSDPNGAFEISRSIILINNSLSATGGCYVYVIASTRQYYLLAANAGSWLGPVTVGAAGLNNGNCNIGAASALTVSGTSMSFTFPIQFGTGFTGTKTIYANVADQYGAWTAWKQAGTFTVQ